MVKGDTAYGRFFDEISDELLGVGVRVSVAGVADQLFECFAAAGQLGQRFFQCCRQGFFLHLDKPQPAFNMKIHGSLHIVRGSDRADAPNRIGNGAGQRQNVLVQIFSSAGSRTTRLPLRAAGLRGSSEKAKRG